MTVNLQQLKGPQSSKQGMWKGYHFSIEGIRNGYLFREKWYIKGLRGWNSRGGGTSQYKNLLSTTPPGENNDPLLWKASYCLVLLIEWTTTLDLLALEGAIQNNWKRYFRQTVQVCKFYNLPVLLTDDYLSLPYRLNWLKYIDYEKVTWTWKEKFS